MSDDPQQYQSPPESIAIARELMREIKEALTKDVDGNFPATYDDRDWAGMNMQPPQTAWQDMNGGERYDLLLHALDESIWSLERSSKWDEPRDRQELAYGFVRDDQRQATPGFRAAALDSLMTRLKAFGDEFACLAHPGEQTALAEKYREFVNEAFEVIAWFAEARPPALGQSVGADAFDHVVANLRQHWHEDGHGDDVETWEEQSAVEKTGYLAGYAAAHGVSFERFVEAAGRTLGLAPGQEFTAGEVQHLLHQMRWAHGDYSDGREDMPAPEEWRKLQAEWTHDYGLRRMEDRGVKFEDVVEREIDHAAEGGKGLVRPVGQQREQLLTPGALAEGRHGPEPAVSDRVHDHGPLRER
jgi:hypothetical protein